MTQTFENYPVMTEEEFRRHARIAVHHGIIESIESGAEVKAGVHRIDGRPCTVRQGDFDSQVFYVGTISKYDQRPERDAYDPYDDSYEGTVYDEYAVVTEAYIQYHRENQIHRAREVST